MEQESRPLSERLCRRALDTLRGPYLKVALVVVVPLSAFSFGSAAASSMDVRGGQAGYSVSTQGVRATAAKTAKVKPEASPVAAHEPTSAESVQPTPTPTPTPTTTEAQQPPQIANPDPTSDPSSDGTPEQSSSPETGPSGVGEVRADLLVASELIDAGC